MKKKYAFPKDTSCCYMFQLTTPKFRRKIKYSDNIVLIGVRNLKTFLEIDPRIVAKENGYATLDYLDKSHFESLNHLVAFVNEQNPFLQKGVVMIDDKNERFSVLSMQSVALDASFGFQNHG